MGIRRGLLLGFWLLVLFGGALLLAGCEQQPIGVRTEEPEATVASASGILTATAPPTATPAPTQTPQPSPTATPTTMPTSAPTVAATVIPSPTATVVAATTLPRPTLVPVEPVLIEHGDRSRARVALTFDAWQTEDLAAGYDEEVIRILTETETPATLFLSGLWMRAHVTETQSLSGVPYFELGNLSWSYTPFSGLPEEAAMAEISRTQDLFHSLTGRQPLLFRLPFGATGDGTLEIVASQGLRSIQWDVLTGDADPNTTAGAIVRAIEDGAQNGAIVVMHANGHGWHTAEALPAVIETLEDGGFELVTVSELLGLEAEPEATAQATPSAGATAPVSATAPATAAATATAAAPAPATGEAPDDATATATPSGGNATVTKGLVNVRQEATTEATVLGTLEEGARVTVLCRLKGQRVDAYDTDKWFRIEYEEGQGYILAFLITPDGDVENCK